MLQVPGRAVDADLAWGKNLQVMRERLVLVSLKGHMLCES